MRSITSQASPAPGMRSLVQDANHLELCVCLLHIAPHIKQAITKSGAERISLDKLVCVVELKSTSDKCSNYGRHRISGILKMRATVAAVVRRKPRTIVPVCVRSNPHPKRRLAKTTSRGYSSTPSTVSPLEVCFHAAALQELASIFA